MQLLGLMGEWVVKWVEQKAVYFNFQSFELGLHGLH